VSDDPVTVLGGVGGAIACLEDLTLLGRRLEEARRSAFAAEAAAIRAAQAIWDLSERSANAFVNGERAGEGMWVLDEDRHLARAVCGPVEKHCAQTVESMAENLRSALGLGSIMGELGQLAWRVAQAQVHYEEAERNAQAEFSDWRGRLMSFGSLAALNPIVGLVSSATSMLGSLAFDVLKSLVTTGQLPSYAELLRGHHSEFRALLGRATGVPFFVPTTAQAARGITALATIIDGETGLAVDVKRLKTTTGLAPSCIESLVWRTQAAKLSDSDPSTGDIGITKVTAADGSISWLVSLSGTQEPASFGTSSNPKDEESNFRALTGDVNAVGLATMAALADAGVKKGEPLVLSGHSQGGIVSAQLAADPAFVAQYSVAAVLTFGSPVSLLKPANSAQWLSLEHEQDLIPLTDGENNARSANHTTVVRDLKTASRSDIRQAGEMVLREPLLAHGAPIYADTAKLVDQSKDPSIEAWRQAAAPVLADGAKAETTYYAVTRR
jgi:hypothetical protein